MTLLRFYFNDQGPVSWRLKGLP